jgi:hypothetical protein
MGGPCDIFSRTRLVPGGESPAAYSASWRAARKTMKAAGTNMDSKSAMIAIATISSMSDLPARTVFSAIMISSPDLNLGLPLPFCQFPPVEPGQA